MKYSEPFENYGTLPFFSETSPAAQQVDGVLPSTDASLPGERWVQYRTLESGINRTLHAPGITHEKPFASIGLHRTLWVPNRPFDATLVMDRQLATAEQPDGSTLSYIVFPTTFQEWFAAGLFVYDEEHEAHTITARFEFFKRSTAFGIRLAS